MKNTFIAIPLLMVVTVMSCCKNDYVSPPKNYMPLETASKLNYSRQIKDETSSSFLDYDTICFTSLHDTLVDGKKLKTYALKPQNSNLIISKTGIRQEGTKYYTRTLKGINTTGPLEYSFLDSEKQVGESWTSNQKVTYTIISKGDFKVNGTLYKSVIGVKEEWVSDIPENTIAYCYYAADIGLIRGDYPVPATEAFPANSRLELPKYYRLTLIK